VWRIENRIFMRRLPSQNTPTGGHRQLARSRTRPKEVRLVLAAVLLLALPVGVGAQDAHGDALPSPPPERISQAVHDPPALQIPPVTAPEPTFHVDVQATPPLETPLDAVRKELAATAGAGGRRPTGSGGATPLAQVDVLPAIYAAIHAYGAMRREHAEADARRQVVEDLARFCAVHDCSQVEPAVEGVIVR
jgi:hypothetical protein